MQLGNLLTPADVAKQLGVTPATVRLWERLGKIRVATKTTYGMRLFTKAEVDRVGARRTRAPGQRSSQSGERHTGQDVTH